MTKENFNRIMAGLEGARRHAAGEDVPGMVIHTPPERSMVERVADAIQAHQTRHGPDYEGLARVAIGAMREPTAPMERAGELKLSWAKYEADDIWSAMIDEALKS